MVGALGPGMVGGAVCESDIESLGRGWPMKSLVFPQIINIYEIINNMSEELNGVRCWEKRMMGILCCQKN